MISKSLLGLILNLLRLGRKIERGEWITTLDRAIMMLKTPIQRTEHKMLESALIDKDLQIELSLPTNICRDLQGQATMKINTKNSDLDHKMSPLGEGQETKA